MTRNFEIKEIFALGRLYEFSSNKRFHLLKNEFLNDDIGTTALALNDQINLETGINLFEAKSEADLLEYEKALNRYTSSFARSLIDFDEIGDEMELLEIEATFSVDRISSSAISVATGLKPLLKELHIIVPDIVGYAKKADAISYISESGSFFLTKKIKLRTSARIILMHLTFDNPDENMQRNFVESDFHFSERRGSRVPSLDEVPSDLMVKSILLFDYDEYEDLLDKPVRLFIKGLERFGSKVEVNGEVKKFHRNVILPPAQSAFTNFYKVRRKGKEKQVRVVSLVKGSKIASKVIFLYGINMDEVAQYMN